MNQKGEGGRGNQRREGEEPTIISWRKKEREGKKEKGRKKKKGREKYIQGKKNQPTIIKRTKVYPIFSELYTPLKFLSSLVAH